MVGLAVVPIHFIDVITESACSLKVKLKVAFVLQFHLYSTLYSARSASIFSNKEPCSTCKAVYFIFWSTAVKKQQCVKFILCCTVHFKLIITILK